MTHRPQLVVDNDPPQRSAGDLFAWLRAIAEDPAVPPSAFRVAFLISQHINASTGTAWPSQEALARLASLSVEAVRLAVVKLRQEGYLIARSGGGRGRSTEYQLTQKPPTQLGGLETETPKKSAPFTAETPNAAWGFSGENPQKSRAKPPKKPGTNYYKNHQKERDIYPPLSSTRSKAPASEPDQDFDRFWSQYPRKVARPAAEKAWRSARKKASAAEIIAGVLRYAAERDGQDPTYTKHPSTWLNGECWADEPTPPRGTPHPQQPRGRTLNPAIAALFGEGR